ncbi:hypothetical protein VTN77DRAFT_5381 [Rasamsonia byssochlamydoides]|uniref:uncharacterized protein n=1 Tax=Rasamsonia byssochlamydoides TaxID=89139 RepID=UPI003744521E
MAPGLMPDAKTSSIPLRRQQQQGPGRRDIGSSDGEEKEAFLRPAGHPRSVAGDSSDSDWSRVGDDDDDSDGHLRRASKDRLVSMNDPERQHDVEHWRLDDLSASDFSDADDDGDNEMTAVLKKWKQKGKIKITNVRNGTLLKALYRSNRLCLLMTVVLLFVFLPWIVFGSRIRDWVWEKHSGEWVSLRRPTHEVVYLVLLVLWFGLTTSWELLLERNSAG